MTQKTYTIDERNRTLRIIPTEPQVPTAKTENSCTADTGNACTAKSGKGYIERPVKSFRIYDDGVIEIEFKEVKPPKPATIKNDKTFGKTTIKFSKLRINLLTSFSKKETDEAITELQNFLPFIRTYLKSQLEQQAAA